MKEKQNRSGNDAKREPYVQMPDKVVQNPNPRANENIRVRTNEPQAQKNDPAKGVGSEITDGEDA